MVAEWVGLSIMGLMLLAELLHAGRCRRLARLAFGPRQRPAPWVSISPLLRIGACGALAWGLTTLLLMDPKVHTSQQIDPRDKKHLLLVIDVSPSMYLEDSGPQKNIARRQRAADLLTSLFSRLPMREYQVSVVAFYTGAKPLLQESSDPEVVQHLVADLPLYIGFPTGKTDLFSGLQLASQMSKSWRPNSTTMVIVTDGVTVPPAGMPRLPNSIRNVLVLGVGDAQTGKFIDGHQSRQDVSNLRQVANRIRGFYHDGNVKHIPTSTVIGFSSGKEGADWWDLTRREWALVAITLSSFVLSFLPILLHYWGTTWLPVNHRRTNPAHANNLLVTRRAHQKSLK